MKNGGCPLEQAETTQIVKAQKNPAAYVSMGTRTVCSRIFIIRRAAVSAVWANGRKCTDPGSYLS